MKQILKKSISRVAAKKVFMDRLLGKGLTVFLFHDVTDKPSEFSARYGLNVTPRLFSQHLDWITEYFNVVSPLDVQAGSTGNRSALITFDDGLAGYFENAIPIMVKRRLPSMIFLNLAPVYGDYFWSGLVTYLCQSDPIFLEKVLCESPSATATTAFLYCRPKMVESYLEGHLDRAKILREAQNFYGSFATPDQLQKAASTGLVFFGNHLFNHYNAAMIDDQELRSAYLRNFETLQKFSNTVNFFSYPYGQPGVCFDERTLGILKEFSPQRVFSAYPYPNSDSAAQLLHRVSLDESVSTLDQFAYRVAVLPRYNSLKGARIPTLN